DLQTRLHRLTLNTIDKPLLLNLNRTKLLRRSTTIPLAAPIQYLSPPPAQSQAAALRRDSLRRGHHLRQSGKTTTTANIGLSLACLSFFVVAIDAKSQTSTSATSTCSSTSRTPSNTQSSRSSMAMSQCLEKTNLDQEDSGFLFQFPQFWLDHARAATNSFGRNNLCS
ncbi:septum site-determining protein, partial [Striga asiatica]